MKQFKIFVFTICALCASVSCSDMLDSDSTRQAFDPDQGAKTDSIFYALGILQGVQEAVDQYVFHGEMRGDLIDTTHYTDNNLRQLSTYSVAEGNPYNEAYKYYRIINNCNYYIAHRDTTLRIGADSVSMNEYAAVKAIRAWSYLQLVRTYGKVKFYTEPLTQISQIEGGNYPEYDLNGIVRALAPDLEQYSGRTVPDYGSGPNTAKSLVTKKLFIPVDIVLGDLYLENNQYEQAAQHYITYLTRVADPTTIYTAFTQSYRSRSRLGFSMDDELPTDWDGTGLAGSTWANIFSNVAGSSDVITYVPMARNSRDGVTTVLPETFGFTYDYNRDRYDFSEEIQVAPSAQYLALSDAQDYYYHSLNSTSTKTVIGAAKLGDTRYRGIIQEDEDDETGTATTWIMKYQTPNIILYRNTTVLLHLAEALNRLDMPDAAFAILKDGINKYMVSTSEEAPTYLKATTKQALQTTYPLLATANLSRFESNSAYFGVHTHGAGFTPDYTGSSYQRELSPYQLDTIVGLKLAELETAIPEYRVGATLQDSINAMEDILCDEYALEFAFEGTRYFDLMRLARHKNEKSPEGCPANFGWVWMKKKLANRNWDESKLYLPFH